MPPEFRSVTYIFAPPCRSSAVWGSPSKPGARFLRRQAAPVTAIEEPRAYDFKENVSVRDLLFLSQEIPFPPSKGEKFRTYHVIEHLKKS